MIFNQIGLNISRDWGKVADELWEKEGHPVKETK